MGITDIKKRTLSKMGAMCGTNKKPKNPEQAKKDIQQLGAPKDQNQQSPPKQEQPQNQSNVVEQQPSNQKEEPKGLQSPPKPEPERVDEEQRQKLIQECLEYVKDVGVEGSVQNMQDNVEIVAVRQDLNFE